MEIATKNKKEALIETGSPSYLQDGPTMTVETGNNSTTIGKTKKEQKMSKILNNIIIP